MISIIVAVHNQLSMNQLFYDSLINTTKEKYELIVIDNDSTDGTREFFSERADKMILNDGNYSYSYCQNQGIRAASYNYLAFFNNDMILSDSWDVRILDLLRARNMSVISIATEPTEDIDRLRQFRQRWKWIRYPMLAVLGRSKWSLKVMMKLMYANFERFCEERYVRFRNVSVEGFSGCSIVMHRSVIDKIGMWDERIYDADFDLSFRLKKRNMEAGDIEPLQIALGVFFHHYCRLTFKGEFKPFADRDRLISLDEKWPERKELSVDFGRVYGFPGRS